VRDCPMKSRESIPLEGSPDHPYIESGRPGYIQRDRFSRLSGRAPEGGKTSKLGLQGRSSCIGVSVRPGMVQRELAMAFVIVSILLVASWRQ
jgi:hypothetical protein